VAFTAFCYHAVRVRAAWGFDAEPPAVVGIRAHIDEIGRIDAARTAAGTAS
jgi:hypothetical protein